MPLKALPGHLARRFHQISTALFDVEMRRAGIDLTPVQYAALVAIRDHPAIDQARLAGLVAIDRTTIGGVVDRLAEKGFVARRPSPTDRRSRTLTVTVEGERILERAGPVVRRAQEHLVASLAPEEIADLLRLLEKVVSHLGDVSRSPRSGLQQ